MTPAAEIKLLSTLATRDAFAELMPQFERTSGQKVVISWAGTIDIVKRVSAGEAYDLIVAAKTTVEDFMRGGRVEQGSCVDIARSGIGVAIPRGAPRPDISSAEALKRALLAAKGIVYSTGPSGVYLAGLFGRFGIADAIKPKSRQVPPGATVGPIIASGEVDIGFQQFSELLHVDGIDLIGPLPAEIQHVTVLSCGIPATANQVDGPRRLMQFLVSPSAKAAIARAGLQPA